MAGREVQTWGDLLGVRGGRKGGRRERGVREHSPKRERRSVTRAVIATRSKPSFLTSTRHHCRNGFHNLPHGRDHTTSAGDTVTSCGNVQQGMRSFLVLSYKGQLDVHGLGFSPDGTLLAVVNVTSNSVVILDTATNVIGVE